MRFRDFIREISPAWAQREWGEKYLYVPGVILDGITQWMMEGIRARFPGKGPPDALAHHGRDRQIRRGFDESRASYEVRLLRWLDDHRIRGNPIAMLEQLAGYLTPHAVKMRLVSQKGTWVTRETDGTITIDRKLANWDWDGVATSPANRTRFWLIVYPPTTLWTVGASFWGGAGLWGGEWGLAGSRQTWGSTATVEQIKTLREIVRDWKPAGTTCVEIILAFDPASFDPATPEPDGLWGAHAKLSGGVWVKSRLDTARYCHGTGA